MTWWTDPEKLTEAVKEYGSPTLAARTLGGVSERNARGAWKRFQETGYPPPPARSAQYLEKMTGVDAGAAPASSTQASATITDTTATLISAANPRGVDAKHPEQLLREHGLDPAEWDYRVSATSWDALAGDGKVTTLHRIKVDAVKRIEASLAFEVPSGWKPPKPRRRDRSRVKPRLVALFADPHFPLHEPALYDASLAWLEEFSPDRIVCLGDEGDWSPFKRHRQNLRTDTSVNEAIWGAYNGLSGWRNCAPNAQIDLIPGNHTTWLHSRILEMFPNAAKITPPGDDHPLISMRNILKLDELHITYHETVGEYHDAIVELAPDLILMHGTKTGKHGGAAKEQDGWEGTSVVQGHDHQLVVTTVNKRAPGGGHTQRYAISAGTMARRDLGYNPAQNVGQGFPVVTIHPCGRWHVDIAFYDPITQSTTWRGWIYKP